MLPGGNEQVAEKLSAVVPGRAEGANPESIIPMFSAQLAPGLWISDRCANKRVRTNGESPGFDSSKPDRL
jgi:hypothetical protein